MGLPQSLPGIRETEMPLSASEIESFDFLRLLVIGPVRVGKTTAVVGTAPKPVYVICSDDKASLKPASKVTSEFQFDLVNSADGATLLKQWEDAFRHAKQEVKAGKIKTVVWDTITSFASLLIAAELLAHMTQDGNEDGRTAYPAYGRRLKSLVSRLITLDCHVIVISHDWTVAPEMKGQLKKKGAGILPNVEGSVRAEIPRFFQDIVYCEKGEGEERVFRTSIPGVFGPGCRNLPGVSTIPADVTKMWKMIESESKNPKNRKK
jgi:hypothetical protein